MTGRQESIFDIVCNVITLKTLIKEHTLEDELCGDHVVIPIKKLEEVISKIRLNITKTCEEEFKRAGNGGRYAKSDKPLIDAILLMNKKKNGKGNSNESQTDNISREADMGETRKYAPFGGIKTNEG